MSTAKTTTTTTASTSKTPVGSHTPRGNQVFLFDKSNYMWMIGGIVLILIGFMLIAGGKSADPHQFNYEELYSFRRITLAPVLIMIGFALEIYAIMKKPVEEKAV
jgi:hypothetical protein